MIVGIINMYSTLYGCRYLINAIHSLGYRTHVVDGVRNSSSALVHTINHSSIRHWIFSGSPTSVVSPDAPQVPPLALLKGKQIMALCYSMESILVQLGVDMKKAAHVQTDIIHLPITKKDPLFEGIKDPMVMRRHHRCFFSSHSLPTSLNLLASYKDQAMIVRFKQSVLIQFHPEKSVDGKKLLLNWLQSSY